MGDAQSAQREDTKDAAAEGASGEVDDAHTEQSAEDKVLQNGGQIAEMNGKADGTVAAFNGHCEDQPPGDDEHVPERGMPLEEEETPLQGVQICPKELPGEADPAEAPAGVIEMDTKQNDINETFRKFFSNIGLKLTVKRGSTDKSVTHVPEEEPQKEQDEEPEEEPEREPEEEESEEEPQKEQEEEPEREPEEEPEEEPQRPEDVDDFAREVQTDSDQHRMDANSAAEVCDNDSTTCPTLTEGTSEDFAENVEEKATETKEEVECDHADLRQDAATEEEPPTKSPPVPVEEVIESPLKKFFTTGIFSGLQKKKKSIQDEGIERELVDTSLKPSAEKEGEPPQDQEQEKLIDPGVEMSPNEKDVLESEPKDKIPFSPSPQTDETKSPSTDPSIIIVTETEILSSQEKVPASPMRRFLSGSSLRRLSRKQGSRRSSDGKLSDSGEYISDHLLSSTESADRQKEESPPQESPGGSAEEDSPWASFKKLMTPKKRLKRPSLGGEEAATAGATVEAKPSEVGQTSKDGKLSESGEQTPHCVPSATEKEGPAPPPPEAPPEEEGAWASFIKLMTPKKRIKKQNEEAEIPETAVEMKATGGEQTQDHSTEEGKKRKDSSVSWEAVLCGSGRKRSRKTSDSGSETPQTDGQKQGTESPLESSNEAHETGASSPEKAESPGDSDEGSTWKLFKKLVTPKKKAKEVTESKDSKHSDSESTQDDSFFSIKKLVPARKKTKSADKSDQASSDEANRDETSYDEDSETPAVVPLSEFDTAETVVQIQTRADVESYPQEEAEELQRDLLDEIPEMALPHETESTDENAAAKKAAPAPVEDAEAGDSSELVSKHQQLSDIPEEGVITETMATLPSVTEEAVRDDTMAEDLIEITSEALTAPEPADVTTADETEMVSAVSQLSESSKTSGDTTPVPDESSDRDTEALLQQAAESIASNPSAAPACSDELSSEGIVYSVWSQILKTFGKEKPKEDADSDADAIVEEDAAGQAESVSDVIDALPTEILPEEIDTAEIVAGTVDDAVVSSQFQEDSGESEITAGSQTGSVDTEQPQQIIAENEAQIVSNNLTAQDRVGAQESDAPTLGKEETDKITEAEIATNEPTQAEDEKSPKDEPGQQDDVESPKAPNIVQEVSEAGEAQTSEKEDESSHVLKQETVAEDKMTFCTEGTVGAASEAAASAATSDSEPSSPRLLEKEETPEAEPENQEPQEETEPKTKYQKMIQFILDVPAAVKKVIEEPRSGAVSPTETHEAPGEAFKTVPAQETHVSDAAAAVTSDTEAEKSQAIVTEAVLEEIEESGEEDQTSPLVAEPEELQTAPTIVLETESDICELPEKETIPEDVQAAETTSDEAAPPSASIAETTDEAQVLEAAPFDSERGSSPVPQETETNEPEGETEPMTNYQKVIQFILDVPVAVKKVLDEPKHRAASPTEAPEDEMETSETAPAVAEPENTHIFKTEVVSYETEASEVVTDEVLSHAEGIIEPDEVPEEIKAPPTNTLDKNEDRRQVLEEKIIKGDSEADDEVTAETKPLNVETLDTTQKLQDAPTENLDLVQTEEKSDDISEADTNEPKEETEPKTKYPKVIQFILDVPAVVKKKIDESKTEAASPTEAEDQPKTERAEEPEVSEAEPAATSDTEVNDSQIIETEVDSEVLGASEAVRDETAPAVEGVAEPADASDTLEAAPTIMLDKEADKSDLMEKETSEDIQAAEIPKDETTRPPADAIEAPQLLEAASDATSDSEPSGAQILQTEEETAASATEAEENEVKGETEPVLKSPTLQKVFQFILDVPAAVKKVLEDPKKEPTSPTQTEDSSDIVHAEEQEVLEAVSATKLDTEAEHLLVTDKEAISEDIQATGAAIEGVVEPEAEVLEAAPSVADPSSPQSLEKEETSEELPAAETEENEPEEETKPETKYPKVIQLLLDVPAVVKKAIHESKKEAESPQDEPQPELPPEAEASDASRLQELQKDTTIENTQEVITEETTALAEGLDEAVSAPEVVPTTEEGDLKEKTPEDIQAEETDEAAAVPEGVVEAPEVSEAAAASTPSTESILPTVVGTEDTSRAASAAETADNEPKEETEPEIKSPKLQKMFQFILDVPAAVKKVIEDHKTGASGASEMDKATMETSDDQPEVTPAIAEDSEAGAAETNAPLLEKETTEDIRAAEGPASPDEGVAEPVDVPEVSETATSDSEPRVPQVVEEEDAPVDSSPAETETIEVKSEQVDDSKDDLAQEKQAVEAPTSDSEVRGPPLLEEVKSEEAEEEQKEEPEPQVTVEDERVELVQEQVVLEAESEAESPQRAGETEKSETKTVETAEDKSESVDGSKTEQLQEIPVPQAEATFHSEKQLEEEEAAQVSTLDAETVHSLSLEKEGISEDVTQNQAVADGAGEEVVASTGDVEPEEASKMEQVQEPEAVEEKTISPEALVEEVSEDVPVVETVKEELKQAEGVSAEPEQPAASQTVPSLEESEAGEEEPQPEKVPAVEDSTCMVTDTKAVEQLEDVSEMNRGRETEGSSREVQSEQEEGATKASNEPETSGTVSDETRSAQILEKDATLEETSAESPEVSNEQTHEEIKTAAVRDVVDKTSHPEDVSAQKSEMQEPMIPHEMELKETTETATSVEVTATETAETPTEVVAMLAPSVELEDNRRIQAQVVDVQSADSVLETALDVGVTETKEVIDVCEETIGEVDTLSAAPETEGGVTNEEDLVSVEDVGQHVRESPQRVPEPEEAETERAMAEEQEDGADDGEATGGESKEAEEEEAMKESREIPEEDAAVVSESPAGATELFSGEHGLMSKSLEDSDVSVHETKDDTADVETSEDPVGSQESAQSHIVTEVQTPSETESEVHETTRMVVSSVRDETSACISADSDETLDAAQHANTPAAGIHAEAAEAEKATQEAESEKQSEPSVPAAEAAGNLDSTERAAVTNQPLDVAAESVGTTEAAERVEPAGDGETAATMQEDELRAGPPEVQDDQWKAEEDNDLDVWLDAEEDVDARGPELHVDLDASPASSTEAEARREETQRTEGEGESESEGEDFAIALEDLELSSIVAKDCD